MNKIKELLELSKTNQNLLTCKDKEKTYLVEVTNNTTNNIKVLVGVINTAYYDPKSKDQPNKFIIIKPGDSYKFDNIFCMKNEKIFISSTSKDVSVVVYENE